MSEGNHTGAAATTDPLTQFWTDLMGRMATAGISAPPNASQEMFDSMRKAFFDVMAKHAEEFMRSEQFLTTMKHAMDNALVFRQQLNQFLTQNLQAMQMPTSADSDHTVLLIRGMEERLLGKLEELSGRVGELEQGLNGTSAGPKSKPKAGVKVRRGR